MWLLKTYILNIVIRYEFAFSLMTLYANVLTDSMLVLTV